MTDHPAFPLPERGSCTGCGACASGCPKGAIHMLPDREGFLYPTVTDACIQCGHCAHICPVRKQREPRSEPAVFAAWNPDAAVRQASTAGGVFPLLAEYILDEGGVVFGAALDEELQVRHIAVKDKAELPRIRGAKPVQSDLGDSFRRVRHYLDQGRRVLFSGTPCQVDGLYHFLGEHPERLLTCDVVCSGVSSPGVWSQLVRSMAYIKRQPPVAVSFCGKLPGEKERRFHVRFDGGAQYDAPFGKSDFGRGLRQRLFLRPVCHHRPPGGPDPGYVSAAPGLSPGGATIQHLPAAGEQRQGRPLFRHPAPEAGEADAGAGGGLQRGAGGPHGPLRPAGGLFRRLCPAALPAGAQPLPVRRPLAPASGEAAEDAEKA